MLKLTNTLSGTKEDFVAIDNEKKSVGMYNCGPTVYDYPHIGNLRKYVFDDVLRRVLEWNGYTVKQVINITDFGHLASDADEGEDKMTKGLKREGKPLTMSAMKELSDFYTEKFVEDIQKLNIELPAVMPKASEHVAEDIALIKKLEDKNFIYKTSDGLYFDTSKLSDYGKLGGITKDMEEGKARIEINTEKKNPRDFAVWKFSSNTELGFPSPWGKGFPGWHIECSAMSMKYLGETFDIHTGGIDHIAIHHNNEIAQSEAATGKPFVHYWIHENFLNIDNTKISKSLKNFFVLKDLEDNHISPLAYRYWLLTAKYSSPANFSWEAVQGAQNAYDKLIETLQNLGENVGQPNESYIEKFSTYINDDLDTPKALALVWELLKDASVSNPDKKATLFRFDEVLGLKLKENSHKQEIIIPDNVQALLQERKEARTKKDFKKSDELRDEIKKLGFEVKDTESGQQISHL